MQAHDVGDAAAVDERSLRYEGWRIVAVVFLLQITIFGFGLYGQGIYIAQLHRLNGWPVSVIGAGSTLCLVLGNILSMFVSELLRWIGPRALVLTGIAALAVSLALLATADSILQLYVGFIVFPLAWVGLGTISAAAIVGAWFDRKRGLAISLTFTGASVSGILLTPGLVLLIEAFGFRQALVMAAVVAAIVLAPIVVAVIRFPPASENAATDDVSASATITRATLLRDEGFWSITAPMSMALVVQVGFIVHQVSIMTPLIGFQSAGGAVSVTTAMALTGRIALSFIADRIRPRWAAAVSIVSQAVALSVIASSTNLDALLVACAVFGFSIGNLVTLPVLITQREFVPRDFGVALGLVMGIAGIVNSFGPVAMGLLRDLTGGYATPILIGVAVQSVAAMAVLVGHRRPGDA
ncbi:MFS transporter [Tardiphaga alba]|uniref:MFS transporter n=1 Tax=Tardiphaga alba TaxID=340268 RepID=A0ABX8A9R5_9BRAD|nr:MFS transporter [Tardiphaga alba]QUS40486.1 MFS transporter [Tardiphaga alba]